MIEFPMAEKPTKTTDWSAVRGELSVLLLIAVFVGLGFIWMEDIKARKIEAENLERLARRIDTDALIMEMLYRNLSGEKPPLNAGQYQFHDTTIKQSMSEVLDKYSNMPLTP